VETRSQRAALKSEFDAYLDEVRQNMQELFDQQHSLPLERMAAMFGQRNKTQLKVLLDMYQKAVPEKSQDTSQQTELFRHDVRRIRGARAKAFRHSVSDAKAIINNALEEQKVLHFILHQMRN